MLLVRLGLLLGLLGGALGLGTTSGSAAPSTVRTPPRGIADNCSADVSARLQKFFARVPNGSTVKMARGGCYLIGRQVTVFGKDRLTLDGQGATFRRKTMTPPELSYPKWNAMLHFGDVTHSTISNLHVRGINTVSDIPELRPDYGAWGTRNAFDHGIVLTGVRDLTLSNTTVDAVFGDGVYIGGSDRSRQAKRVRLTNVHVDRNGRQGIAITSAEGVLLDRVTIAHSRLSGIDMEPHRDKVVSKVEIRNSKITSWLLAITGGGDGAVSNVFIHDNTILRSALPLVHDRSSGNDPSRRHGWDVVDNAVAFTVNSSVAALGFVGTDDVLVHGNSMIFERGSRLAVAVSATDATVRCNHFRGAVAGFVTKDPTSTVRLRGNSRNRHVPSCAEPAKPVWVMDAANKPGKPHRPTS